MITQNNSKVKSEIREGAYCTQCGKPIKKGKWSLRDGYIIKYFFGLFEKINFEHYFCSNKCDKRFWKAQNITKPNKMKSTPPMTKVKGGRK